MLYVKSSQFLSRDDKTWAESDSNIMHHLSRGKQNTWAGLSDTLTDGCSFFVQTMEPVDKLLQCVDPCKDRELWVRENKTGEIRPVDVEIWPQRCLTALHMHTFTPPQLTLKQRLQPEAWLKSAGIFTPPTDPLVTPNRLGDDQSALTGSSHPHISLLRTRAVFGEFSEWRWSDEWRCQVAAGCSFLFMHDDVSWDGTGKLEPWVWIVRRMIEKHQRWTLNTCKCWVAFCHAAA